MQRSLCAAVLLLCLGACSGRPLGEVSVGVYPGGADAFLPRYVEQPPALGTKATGLIITDRTWDEDGKPRGVGIPDEVDFYTGGPSVFALYLPNRAKAGAREFQQWHLSAPFTLVEVEVSGVRSGQLVTTGVRSVEGTAQYPLRVTPVYQELKARYLNYLAAHQAETDREVAQARREALGNEPQTGGLQTLLYHRLDWQPQKQQLDVRFLTQIAGGAYQAKTGLAGAMTRQTWTEGHGFRVQMGMQYVVGADGALVKALRLPLSHEQTMNSPPPSRPGLPQR